MSGFGVVATLLGVTAATAVALTAIKFLRPPKRVQVEKITTWQLIIPRDAAFSVAQAAAWFVSLSPLLSAVGPTLRVEVYGERRELCLLVSAPADWEPHIRAQLTAWFPAARLHELTSERPPLSVVPLALQKPDIHPLRIPSDGETDPLLGVVAMMTERDIRRGFRIELGTAPADWEAWAPAASAAVARGQHLPPRGYHFIFWRIIRFFRGAKVSGSHLSSAAPSLAAYAAATKVSEPAFGVRLSAFADFAPAAEQCAEALAEQLRIGFRHPFGNCLAPATVATARRSQPPEPPLVTLSASELGALFHLPQSDHPLVRSEPTKRAQAPVRVLRTNSTTTDSETLVLGEALTREQPVPFGLRSDDRRFHTYVVGKTGTGKSTLLATIARQDLECGRGFGLIDPHGDLAEQVLSMVPECRLQDVLYFNPADAGYPIGFNILAAASPEQRPLIASGVVGVFKKLYGESWGPRLEYFLRNAILTLLETPSPSLLSLPRLLTDRPYRERLLQHVHDPLLRSFFLEEFPGYDPRWRSEAISPILNKVGQFLSSPVVRHVVGQSGPGFNLRELMDRGGIFVANLSSGKIGEDNAALLGGLLVAGFQLAAISRADQPHEQRRDFFLCIDEFQHFANDAFAGILSEARKYRLSLTLSHQYLDQLPPGISDAVFGNAGTLCVFRVGAQDTIRLAREMAPVFDGQDLVHLPNYHFCARVNRCGEIIPAFSARTIALSCVNGDIAAVVDESRQRWARTKAEVETEIHDAWEGRSD